MESAETTSLDIEHAIIAVGSFLYNSDNCIQDIDKYFLEDLKLLIQTELERREAELH
jgi:hypothetical protein|tara:strand:+ start:3457 stop:3627 length:171 start_codon:yes stop_codon:yes gene_type:complete